LLRFSPRAGALAPMVTCGALLQGRLGEGSAGDGGAGAGQASPDRTSGRGSGITRCAGSYSSFATRVTAITGSGLAAANS